MAGTKWMKRMALGMCAAVVCVFGLAEFASAGEGAIDKVDNSDMAIGVAVYKFEDTFVSMIRNAMVETCKKFGTRIDIVDSQNKQPVQNDQIDLYLTKGVDALVINPVDRTSAGPLIEKAKLDGVPVVFFDREPLPEAMQSYDKVWYVGGVDREAGTMCADIILNYFKKHPEADRNGDGKIQYILLMGEIGAQDATMRTEYSEKTMAEHGAEQVGKDTAMWDKVFATNKMEGFISSIGIENIEAIIANNDDMALGAIEALKANGYNTGDPDKFIPAVGIDATEAALEDLKNGELYATILADSKGMGDACVKIVLASAKGMDVSKETIGYEVTGGKYVWIPHTPITMDDK